MKGLAEIRYITLEWPGHRIAGEELHLNKGPCAFDENEARTKPGQPGLEVIGVIRRLIRNTCLSEAR